MLNRAKKIAAELTRQLARPVIVATVPHEVRGLMADLAAEVIEINQRLDVLERLAFFKRDGIFVKEDSNSEN